MVLLVLLCLVLGLVIAALAARPFLRARPALKPVLWITLGCIAILTIGATVLYASLSRGSQPKLTATRSPQAMVEQLARRLQAHPQDLNGWLMLGRSYLVLREYPLAARAYQHAVQLAGANTPALLGEAQALMMSDHGALTGRAGELIERALAQSPDDPRALYYGAIVALHRGELALARSRFQQLLALSPAPDMRRVVTRQIAAIDRRLGASPAHRAGGAAAVIRVRIRLAPALARSASRSAALYVFVRDPAHPAVPLAVKRLRNRFPQTVVLLPTDAMVAGHAFHVGERVEVIARIAPSGSPLDHSGDMSGQTRYDVGRDGLAQLRIDHVTR